MSSRFVLVWATGSAEYDSQIVLQFAPSYTVCLLCSPEHDVKQTVKMVQGAGREVLTFTMNSTKPADLKDTIGQITQRLGTKCAAAIFHAPSSPPRPFLEQTVSSLRSETIVPASSAYAFAQQAIPLLLNNVSGSNFPSTLLFVGPPGNSSFDEVTDNALVALSRSLGREFGKKCIHIAHIKFKRDAGRTETGTVSDVDNKSPATAEAAWHLHTQPLNCFNNELTL